MASHFPLITITFPNTINVSVQVGDTAYYLDNMTSLGSGSLFPGHIPTTHNHSNYNDIIQIGDIVSINRGQMQMTCNWNPNPPMAAFPTIGDFIMFSKDNKVNLSSLLGYYAEIQIVNNSRTEAELFSIAADVFGSSK